MSFRSGLAKLALAKFALIVFSVTTLAAPVGAADRATNLISDLGRRTIEILTQKELPESVREQRFRRLFEEGFDINIVSRFALGRYWNTSSEQQRKEFQKLFESYVVKAYTVRFSEYTDQQFKVTGSRTQSDDEFLVTSEIIRPEGGPPIKIDWRVVNGSAGPKITDVIVEGVSMAITQREQFASVIQRNGGEVDALLKLLREKTGQS